MFVYAICDRKSVATNRRMGDTTRYRQQLTKEIASDAIRKVGGKLCAQGVELRRGAPTEARSRGLGTSRVVTMNTLESGPAHRYTPKDRVEATRTIVLDAL